jgi:hypothetical protein
VPKRDLRSRAIVELDRQYELAAKMAHANLDSLNWPLPESLKYASSHHVFREWLARASAANNFACCLGLITGEDSLAIIRRFMAKNPDLTGDDNSS